MVILSDARTFLFGHGGAWRAAPRPRPADLPERRSQPRPKQRPLNLTLGSPVVPWRKAVCRLETPPEVRHVRKAPAIGDIADGPMLLKRVFQRHPAPGQPSGLDQPSGRGVLLRKKRVSRRLS